MHLSLVLVGLSLALLGAAAYNISSRSGLEVIFLDVGQGDSAWLRFSDGSNWLVDSGGKSGNRNIGESVVLPELLRRGAMTIEAAIVSHPDTDHAVGFLALLPKLRIDTLVVHADLVSSTNPNAIALRQASTAAKTQMIAIRRARSASVSGATVSLYPLTSGATSNDRNLVLLLEYGGCRMLFPGDVEKLGEQELSRDIRLFDIDLLKVAHHGSKTSSSDILLRQLRPRWAVVSVGLHNQYRHPNATVLNQLRIHGTQVFRTDFHGFVRFRIAPDGVVQCDSALGACGTSHCARKHL